MFIKNKSITQKELPAASYLDCHAKTDDNNQPGIRVREHLVNVAEVCTALRQMLPERFHRLADFAVSVAAVHDIGKVSPGFQLKYFSVNVKKQVPELDVSRISHFCTDHSHTGACALWHHLGAPFSDPPPAAVITAVHHGAMRDDPLPGDTGEIFGGTAWSLERNLLIREMEKQYGALEKKHLPLFMRDLATGMVTVADWIGSDETFFSSSEFGERISATDTAQKAVEACGLGKPQVIQNLSFKNIFGFSPFETQKTFGEMVEGPGVYVLEAPTGTGKTEAALFAAYRLLAKGHHTGIFFGLPTRLTSDRIFQRIQVFLENICGESRQPKLAHGTAWLSEYRIGGKELAPGRSWFSPRKRALLHPFVIGTIDQALMSVIRVRHHFVRTFALAGKVVILDEVHSYDGYTGTLLDEMVMGLAELGCTVIILSATLTAERRAAFFSGRTPENRPEYPLITGSSFVKACAPPFKKTYRILMKSLSDTEVANIAIKAARSKNCVLCIANTVARAQAWYEHILAEMRENEFDVGLLHSKFPGFRRTQIEDQWMEILGKTGVRPDGCILVATQVVEQSVDIDADYLITELAPTDMILQRMGRQWRHNRHHRPSRMPETIIVAEDISDSENLDDLYTAIGRSNCKVYSPWVLWKTWSVWKDRSILTLPNDIRTLLEQTYLPPSPDMPDIAGLLYDEFLQMKNALTGKARGMLSTVSLMPTGQDQERCATRYNDLPSVQVLLVKDISNNTEHAAQLILASEERVDVNKYAFDFCVAQALHNHLISMPTYLAARYGEIRTPPYLQKYFYENTPVIEWDDISGKIKMNGCPTDFQYSHSKGLFRKLTDRDTPSVASSYQSDWEDIDIFDKARFDW